MKRREFKRKIDGAILEIPLWGNYGYAYAKYIDGTKHPELGTLVDLIKVYNFKCNDPLDDLSILSSKSYLHNGILVAGLPPTVTKGYWKVIGKFTINEQDLKAPEFRKYYDLNKKWVIVKDGAKEEYRNLCEIKDLEMYSYLGSGNIEIRLTIIFMKMYKDDPRELLDFSDKAVSYIYTEYFEED